MLVGQVGSMGRAALLVAASFALCAHGYSPQPVGALSSDVDTREYCGRLGLGDATTPRTQGELGSECVVCAAAPSSHLLVPCGHRCVCGPCGERICEAPDASDPSSSWNRLVCPICREVPSGVYCVVEHVGD